MLSNDNTMESIERDDPLLGGHFCCYGPFFPIARTRLLFPLALAKLNMSDTQRLSPHRSVKTIIGITMQACVRFAPVATTLVASFLIVR